MREVFKSESSKPIPKIAQKPLWFWRTPNFAKIPKKLGFKEWDAWKWENRCLPSEEKLKKLEEHLGKRFGVRESDLGGEQVQTDRGNENWIATNQYIELQ